jgi:hypothetical protein
MTESNEFFFFVNVNVVLEHFVAPEVWFILYP